MKLRNFSPATQKSYLYAVTRLARYYRRPPDQLDKEQIRSYLLHLTVERKLSPNTTMTGQISGLRFFYNETLGWDQTKLFIPARKKSFPLPEVFSPSEVLRVIDAAGHMQKCDSCGFERPAYNSCRNRHCPKCQPLAKLKWLDKQNQNSCRWDTFISCSRCLTNSTL